MRLSSFGRGSEIQVIGERIIAKPRFQTGVVLETCIVLLSAIAAQPFVELFYNGVTSIRQLSPSC
jgi:hypothetical protein